MAPPGGWGEDNNLYLKGGFGCPTAMEWQGRDLNPGAPALEAMVLTTTLHCCWDASALGVDEMTQSSLWRQETE